MAGSFPPKVKAPALPLRHLRADVFSPASPTCECPGAPSAVALGASCAAALPDVALPHHSHLDPERIPVPAVSRSVRVHAEEVSRCRRLLTLEQRQNPGYAGNSPN
ncbi:hypothetical protein D1007_37609 [Hordeum vulgare]|nr:hypothetical protein D1007_37609 [Hordeum vulgare]